MEAGGPLEKGDEPRGPAPRGGSDQGTPGPLARSLDPGFLRALPGFLRVPAVDYGRSGRGWPPRETDFLTRVRISLYR